MAISSEDEMLEIIRIQINANTLEKDNNQTKKGG